MLLTVVYHTDWTTSARNRFFLEFDGPLIDASSGSKMRRCFLLTTWASVRCNSTSYMRLLQFYRVESINDITLYITAQRHLMCVR